MKSESILFQIGVVVAVSLVLLSTFAGLAAADEHEDNDEDDDDDSPVIEIDIDAIVDAIEDLIDSFEGFTGSWNDTLKDVLIAVIFRPFRTLAQQLVNSVAIVLTNTPTVYPNPAVESVHRQVLLVTYLLASLAFAGAGVLYMIGPVLGVSYGAVRMMLPRLVLALIFGTVAPQLLQYSVELSDALLFAFMPANLSMSITEMAGLSVSLVLVWIIEAAVLLVVVIMFIIRDVYLLFTAAIAPILALAWAIPPTKRYADSFIAGYWTALAMGPLDMLVLKLNLALMSGAGSTPIQSISNWVLGVAGFILLIWVPLQLYGASQAAVGQAYVLAHGLQNRVRSHRRKQERREYRQKRLQAVRNRRQNRRDGVR